MIGTDLALPVSLATGSSTSMTSLLRSIPSARAPRRSSGAGNDPGISMNSGNSNYASATSGSSERGSGGKRSFHSGGSMDSHRDAVAAALGVGPGERGGAGSGLSRQMNIFLRSKMFLSLREKFFDNLYTILRNPQRNPHVRKCSRQFIINPTNLFLLRE